jgi:hypothetical protein
MRKFPIQKSKSPATNEQLFSGMTPLRLQFAKNVAFIISKPTEVEVSRVTHISIRP